MTGQVTYEEGVLLQRTMRCGECGSGLLMPYLGRPNAYGLRCVRDPTHKTTTPIRRTRILADGEEYNVSNQQLVVPANSVELDVPRGSLELTKGSLQLSKQELDLVAEFIHDVLKPQVHYGTVPGIPKPFLWKAGAEDLMNFFRCYPVHQQIERQFDIHTKLVLYHYQTNAVLRGTNMVMQSGQGACTNYEVKYRWREAQRQCPHCHKAAIRRGSQEYGGGWYCAARDGGCGANFRGEEIALIDNQTVGRVENEDMLDLTNTILKMAIKRSDKDCAERFPGVASFFASPEGAEREVAESQEDSAEGVAQPASRQRPAPKPTAARPQARPGPDQHTCLLPEHNNARLFHNNDGSYSHRLADRSLCYGGAAGSTGSPPAGQATPPSQDAPADLPPSVSQDEAELRAAVTAANFDTLEQFCELNLRVPNLQAWRAAGKTIAQALTLVPGYRAKPRQGGG